MDIKEFVKKMENLVYVFDVSDRYIPVHDEIFWKQIYNIDGVTASIFRAMPASMLNTKANFCTVECAKFLEATYRTFAESESKPVFDWLYDKAVSIFKSEYRRIGFLTEQDFFQKMFEWPEIYNLEESFDESHYTKDDDPYYISRKYRIHFGADPELLRRHILRVYNLGCIPFDDPLYALIDGFAWPIFVPEEERPKFNCYDLAYKALTSFFEDEGRRK